MGLLAHFSLKSGGLTILKLKLQSLTLRVKQMTGI